jgi:pSer/pThr/pTyr-binding forkhead associated (FHA) protein
MALITLRVLHGADRGKVYDRIPTPVTIGREEGNSIQLNDERISRYHLKLQDDNDRIVATDLESTNGTKVNGEDIQVRIVRDGDMISLGRSLLLVGSHSDIDRRILELAGRHPADEDEKAREMRERLERIAAGPSQPGPVGRTHGTARLRAGRAAHGHRGGGNPAGRGTGGTRLRRLAGRARPPGPAGHAPAPGGRQAVAGVRYNRALPREAHG